VLRPPTFDEIRLLEDLDPLHPWLANLRRFSHHAGARTALPQEYQCLCQAGVLRRDHRLRRHQHRHPPVSPASNQQPRNHMRNFNSARAVHYLAT
jgi:hypothetical protein